MLPSRPAPSQTLPALTPNIKVLNYALALETLEAQLYKDALARLTGGGTDSLGQHITGLGLAASELDVKYLTEFGTVEAEHQAFLEGALGGNWAAAAGAKFDFGFADTNQFNKPPLTRLQTTQLVYAAEQTGVSAYLGGAGPGGLTPGSTDLAYAASILGTEARHTATVAILLNSPTFNESPKLATAPLSTDKGTDNGPGLDTALAPDAVLYSGGQVAADTTVAGDGRHPPDFRSQRLRIRDVTESEPHQKRPAYFLRSKSGVFRVWLKT